MRALKVLLLSLFLVFACSPVFALITTDNVDKDTFQYEVGYKFATTDLAASYAAYEMSVETGLGSTANEIYFYTIPRDGVVVGMSVAGNTAIVGGSATFDVTINNQLTGIQTVIEPTPGTVRTAVGISGSAGNLYAFIRHDRATSVVEQGFRKVEDRTSSYHNSEHPYGKATAITAGNRIGVKVTTDSSLSGTTGDFVVVVYVLQ